MQILPTEAVYEVTHWFAKAVQGRVPQKMITASASGGRLHCRSHENAEAADNTSGEKFGGLTSKKREISTPWYSCTRRTLRALSKTVVDWINGYAKQNAAVLLMGAAQVSQRRRFTGKS